MDDLVPVVVGALLALVGGLLGAWIQGRREHRRWVREQRFEAYQRALRFVERMRTVGTDDLSNALVEFVHEQMPGAPSSEVEEMLAVMRESLGETERPTENLRSLRALSEERVEVMTLIALLGPSEVATRLNETVAAINDDDDDHDDQYYAALEGLLGAMWKPLGIMKPYRIRLATTARQPRQPAPGEGER